MNRSALAALMALSLVTGGLSSPLAAQPAASPSSALRGCLAAARGPLTASAAYRNGGARQKEVLRNGYNPDTAAMTALCVRLDKAPPSDRPALATDCHSLIEAQARKRPSATYLRPFAASCSAMTGQSVTSS